jgi:putative ABC transport system permease protein
LAQALVPPSIRIGLQALRSNPLRTVLSTLGVIMGVASLVAVLAIGDGVELYARTQIERTTSLQSVGLAPKMADRVDGMAVPRSGWPTFDQQDAAAMQRLVGGRGAVSLSLQGRSIVEADGVDSLRATLVVATDSLGIAQRGVEIAHGRMFGAREVRDATPVAVLTDRLAKLLSPPDPAALVGDTIRLNDEPFTVAGVLAPLEMDEPFNVVLVPFSTAERAFIPTFGVPAAAPALSAHLNRIEDADSVKAQVERWARARWGDSVEVQAGAKMRLEQVETGMLIFKLAMGSFAAIAIIVGGIGIMNVLLASVFERTREIGIRKATGARNRDIMAQFLAESVAITGAGSLVGVVLGLAGAFAVTAIMRAQTEAEVYAAVTVPSLAVAALVAVVTGLAFGSYPAVRAARLSPIDAIRHE